MKYKKQNILQNPYFIKRIFIIQHIEYFVTTDVRRIIYFFYVYMTRCACESFYKFLLFIIIFYYHSLQKNFVCSFIIFLDIAASIKIHSTQLVPTVISIE